MNSSNNITVTCFGEILWDLLPSRKQPGGAPMNVAMHLKKLGVNAEMISRIGKDKLGLEMLDYLKSNKLRTDFIQIDESHMTGIVKVILDDWRNATYNIVKPVAWDFIELDDRAISLVKKSDYFVFGSLVARNQTSNDTLLDLIKYARKKVFDINLRKPHYNKEKIAQLLALADIVKLNEDEAAMLKEWFGESGDALDVVCKKIKEEFSIETMIVTMGHKGALVYDKDEVFMNAGFKVITQDTIGAGDSFLAAFLAKYFEKKTIPECLEYACGTGAYVATCVGANPDYSQDDILKFINERKKWEEVFA